MGTDDITLDNVLNTGADGDRNPINTPTPNPDTGGDKPPVPAPSGGKPDDTTGGNTPPDGDDGNNSDNLKGLLSTFGNEDGLSADDIATRTALLEKYGGHTFDQHGNIIDEAGNVHKSFDDLLEFAESDETTSLDSNGNQIDEDGNITKTALELARENTVVNQLHHKSGYEFLDEAGQPKIYADDESGFHELTNDMSGQRFAEWKQDFFSQTPELAEITKHLLSGGSVDTFVSSTDYSQIDAAKLSDAETERYVRRSFEIKGFDKERVDDFIQLFKDSNTMNTQVLKSLDELAEYEDVIAENRDQQYQNSIDARNQQMEDYWDDVEDTVVSGKLGDINIPENDQQGFFDYLSASVDDKGNSREMLDRGNETLEQQLTFAFLRYKGYDLNKLVDSKVKISKVKSLKDQLKRSAKLKQTTTSSDTKGGRKNGADVTIADIL